MKHCLKQRKKKQERFTKTFIGLDHIWQNEEVTIRFKDGLITMWGQDDFGMEKVDATEQDWIELINDCIAGFGFTPAFARLKQLGFKPA